MKKLPNLNELSKRPPTAQELRKAKVLAKRVSAKLYSMMEAKPLPK